MQDTYLKEYNSTKNQIRKNLSYNINYFRNLILIIDMTERSVNNDNFKNKLEILKGKIRNFIYEFFNYNYTSNISILEINDYFTNLICNSSNDPNTLIESLNKLKKPIGYPSLANALNVCFEFTKLLEFPKTGIDLAIFYFNDNTFDRINFNEILDNYIDNKITINVLTFETPFEFLKVSIP